MDDLKRSLDKIEQKVDKLDGRLDRIDLRLEKYNAELEFHVARTTQLEDALLPIRNHVQQMRGAGKLLVWCSVLATIAGGISWLWSR